MYAKISLDTSEYENGISNAGKTASGFGQTIKNGLIKAFQFGAAAIGAATTAVVAFAKSSVETGMQFDSSMSQVAATMGVTVDEIQDLRDFAMEMGSTTAFSATQAADALNYMALAGYDAETSMAMLPNVLNLAAAGGIELATASDMVTDAQSALGLSLEETSVMVDQMAKASSKSNTSVAQLGEAILTVGGTAQYMAGGTEELNTVLGVLADNGIKGSEAGTHLRNMLLSLSSPTSDAQKTLDALGVTVFDAEGNMRSFADIFPELNSAMASMTDQEKLDAFSTLFNSRDIASATALLSTTTERWEELGGAILDSAGAAQQMADTQLDNLAGDITLFKSALEGAQILISDQLTPSLRGFVQFGSNAISTLSSAFKEGGLSGAMAALGTILSEGLNMVIAALPSFIDAGMELLGALGQGLLDNIDIIASAATDVLLMLTEALISATPSVLEAGAQILVTLISGIGEALPELIPQLVEAVLMIGQVLIDNAPLLLDAGMQLLMGLADGILGALPILVSQLPQIIVSIYDTLSANLPTILQQGAQILLSLASGILQALPQLVAQLPQIITSIVTFVTSNLPQILQLGLQLLGQLGMGILQAIPQLVAQLPQVVMAIVNGLGQAVKMVAEIGKNIVRGIWDGISGAAGWLYDQVKGFLSGIVDSVKNFLGIHSPSRVFADIGANMAAGLGEGWDDEYADIKKDIESGLDFGVGTVAVNGSGIGGAIGGINVTQNIYAKEHSAADLMKEAAWQARRAVLSGV